MRMKFHFQKQWQHQELNEVQQLRKLHVLEKEMQHWKQRQEKLLRQDENVEQLHWKPLEDENEVAARKDQLKGDDDSRFLILFSEINKF